ncbi:hypothetical protein MCC93_25270 [Morococcus cerebrosus]|uniref:Uncharacterized protein n=1 Tax=Morococcus cerebrosus TaxID=1056807 RepID=A0A0C1GW14_9NEIS|nr:hypothetical protein MCC93_25270 [Morococcus cerebrosus]
MPHYIADSNKKDTERQPHDTVRLFSNRFFRRPQDASVQK